MNITLAGIGIYSYGPDLAIELIQFPIDHCFGGKEKAFLPTLDPR